ncbi:MAG: hypothetical protein R2681_07920 [Pyrinomonadaceae bacterium]
MAQAINTINNLDSSAVSDDVPAKRGYQAYTILHAGFTVLPVVMGLDKFFYVLADWDKFLPGFVNNMLGGYGHQLMFVVGVIEIVAGIGIWLKPKIFAFVVAAWLFLIIVNLLLVTGFLDVALRDFGLLLGAVALGRLSQDYSG